MSAETPGSPASGTLNLDAYPRTLGVLFLLLGLICGLVAFYFPIQDILQGASQITLYSKAVFAFLIFTLMGLTFIILGPIPARLALKYAGLRGWQKWLVIGLVLVVFMVAGVLVQEAIERYLGELGYQVKFA